MTKIVEYWDSKNNCLNRTFEFKNFLEAIEFINKMAQIAETYQHHPDFTLFQYRFVSVSLTTNDKNKTITEKDINLAAKLNDIFK